MSVVTEGRATGGPDGSAGPLLSLRGISKHFGPVHALNDVDLDVPAGQITALVGDNGAGKSTLIKTIAGIWAPTSGTISWEGRPVEIRTPKEADNLGIATVYQDLALCDNLDIVQNMFLGHEDLTHRLLDETRMELTAKQTLADLSVTTVQSVRQLVGSLSGGQRQSVAVARAVMRDARLVIMDEPTAALGVSQTAQVLDLIHTLGSRRHRRHRDLPQPQRRLRGGRPSGRALPRPPGEQRTHRRVRPPAGRRTHHDRSQRRRRTGRPRHDRHGRLNPWRPTRSRARPRAPARCGPTSRARHRSSRTTTLR